LCPGASGIDPPPRDRGKARIPVPLPRIASGARGGVAVGHAVVLALAPVPLQRMTAEGQKLAIWGLRPLLGGAVDRGGHRRMFTQGVAVRPRGALHYRTHVRPNAFSAITRTEEK